MIAADGRVLMISGPARGLGRALAERLRGEGYRLSLGGRDPAAIGAMVAESGSGPEVSVHRFDATDGESARAWVSDTMTEHGRIDGLINNAGLLERFGLDDYDEAAFDAMWEINVKAPTLLTHLVLPHLRAAGDGRVVNIASASGKRVKGGFSPGYAMTKHAVMALTHATRQHGWADGIRAVAVCPSFIATEMIADVDTGAEPVIEPADLAELITTWLALPGSASVAELIVNCRLEDAL
ncbi:MAG: SDR family NAD(P)-dependent oxidoreductase [Actinomycetota bacterium]